MLTVALGLVGCVGPTSPGDGSHNDPHVHPDIGDWLASHKDPNPGGASVAIVSPAPGSLHIRDVVGTLGALVAPVEVQVESSGRFARIELVTGQGEFLGIAGDDSRVFAEIVDSGEVTVMAIAYDTDGRPVAGDATSIQVEDPAIADCHQWLDLYGLTYEVGPNNQGVSQPVTVDVPINGVSYGYFWSENRRERFFMDCRLALSLARAAYHLRRRDIIEVRDMGVYNYRCISNAGTPPNCTYGMSQHAYARGIDIGGLLSGDGTFYSVEDDWIIDPDGVTTCAAATAPGKDRFLHELICDLKAADVWNIVLTPNYNAAHRNHFHVDLTTGADSINRAGEAAVDVGPDHH